VSEPKRDGLLVDLENITVARGDKNVLRGFTLKMRRGEHVALLGPNGSGKSTLVKLITGELYPHTGVRKWRFRLFDQDSWSLDDVRRRVGIVTLDMLSHLSHEITTREVTAREMVLSGFFNSLGLWPHHVVTAAHERRARELLEFLEITHLANRSMAQMSSGEQRRALIGRALVHDPEAMILDEATASLDPGAVKEFLGILSKLAQSGKSLIVVTHQISDLIPEIERIILIKEGRIVADGPKKKLLTSEALSDLFGAKLRVVRRKSSYDVVAG
jgi:iron complex transport system ATP-binding protein